MTSARSMVIDRFSPPGEAYAPDSGACDPTEAPAGFHAVPKASLRKDQGNLCRQCDWRAECNNPSTDLLAFGHRCMSVAVVATRDGKTYRRNDRCSVVFKRTTHA